jgi:hypothetical protein
LEGSGLLTCGEKGPEQSLISIALEDNPSAVQRCQGAQLAVADECLILALNVKENMESYGSPQPLFIACHATQRTLETIE